ncbi:MAG: winged helix DNA-binding domain-containing protein, partial [Acidimicrobiia bacterium]|nr:winged helix DNA-binding domain-containing protein [Acidimicrobiia bacterium]
LMERLDTPTMVPEVQTVLTDLVGEPVPDGVWWAVRQFAPVVHAPTDALWMFGHRPSFIAGPLGPNPPTHDDAVAAFFLRYLQAFGPASRHDFAQFTLLTQASIVPTIEALGDELVELEGPNGEVLYDVVGGEIVDDAPVPARLLGMWDSVLLAYADRSRVIPDDIRKTVIRSNGDVLPTLLVDGYVAGVWRVVDGVVEAKTLRPITESDWTALAAEAVALGPLLDRDPNLFSRYYRWWSKIDALETRVLT